MSSGARVLVAGGHSAGHIEPAMNLADALRALDPTVEITALGTERGLDTTLIPARGYPLELIPPVPLPRRPGRALLATPGKLNAAVRAAADVMERHGIDVVVGFGGYVAMPAYLAARRRDIPIVLHEANARPGVLYGCRMPRRSASRCVRTSPGWTAPNCAPTPGWTSACCPTRRRCWSPAAPRAPARSTPRWRARPTRYARPGCRYCTSSDPRTPWT